MAREGLQFEFSAVTTEYRKAVESMPRDLKKAADEIEEIGQEINSSMSGAVGRGLVQGLAMAGAALSLRNIISEFDKVADSAKRFGTSAEDIQRVDFAAKSTGTSVEVVASAMESAGVRANKAARGVAEMAEAFSRAGIDAAAFSMADLSERIEMVAQAQKLAAGDAQQLANITEALGQSVSGVDFGSMAEGMRDVSVASNETVEQLSAANDQIVKFEHNVKIGVASALGLFASLNERLGTTFAALEQDPFSFEPNPIMGKTIAELEEMEDALEPLPPLFERSAAATDQATASAVNYSSVLSQLIEVNAQMEAGMARMGKSAESLAAQLAEAELRFAQLSQEFAQSGDADVFKELEKTTREILSLRQKTAQEEAKIANEAAKTSAEYLKQAESQARAISSAEEEIKLLEAKLSGNEELTDYLKRQQDFREVFDKTKDSELADRVAELRSQERMGAPGATSGSSGSGGGRGGAFVDREMTRRERMAEMKGNARARRDDELAARYESAGFFGSAVTAQDRARRRRDEAMTRARETDFMSDMFDATNIGESLRNFEKEAFNAGMGPDEALSRMGIDREVGEDRADALKRFVEEQAKTPQQRAREEEEARDKHGAKGGKSDMEKDIADILDKIQKHLPKIDEKLPQTALVYS
jgi:hypothetical protein